MLCYHLWFMFKNCGHLPWFCTRLSEAAENSHKTSNPCIISYVSSLCPLIFFFFPPVKHCFACQNF